MQRLEMMGCNQGIRGARQPQVEALCDIKAIDTDAPSRSKCPPCPPESVLESGAKEKKRVYEQAIVEQRGNLTPIVCQLMDFCTETEHFLKRLAVNLPRISENPILKSGAMLGHDQPPLSIIRSSLSSRDSRVKWRSGFGGEAPPSLCQADHVVGGIIIVNVMIHLDGQLLFVTNLIMHNFGS